MSLQLPEHLTPLMARKKRAAQHTNPNFNPIIPPDLADQQRQAQKMTLYNLSSCTKGQRNQQRTIRVHVMDIDTEKPPDEDSADFIEGTSGNAVSGNAEPDSAAATVVVKELKKRRRIVSLFICLCEASLTFQMPGTRPDVNAIPCIIPR